MNFVQLKYFHAVCVYQNVSKAAEYLHISQPSLSSALKELEREFGVILFRRHYRGMELTREGEVLYKISDDLLNRADEIEHIMKNLGSERKLLRLGVPPMIGFLLLPQIYKEFLPMHPDISLEITEEGRKELMAKLSDDFLDMVFLPHNRPLEKNFSALQVGQLEIVCCASKNNPVSMYKTVRAADLADTPVVLFKNGFFQTEEIKRWFAHAGVTPDVIVQTQQLSTVQSMISNNLAVGFLFRQLVEANPDFVPVSTQPPLYINVSLVWKKNAFFFNSMRQFKKYICDANVLNNSC